MFTNSPATLSLTNLHQLTSESDVIFEKLGFDMPKVIKEKWTNNLYQDVKPMLNDKAALAYNLPEFKSSSYLKGFGSETIKWINNGNGNANNNNSDANKGKLFTTKLFSSRSFIAENPNRPIIAIQEQRQQQQQQQAKILISNDTSNKQNKTTRFSYNLENNNNINKNVSLQLNQNTVKKPIVRNSVYDPTTSLGSKAGAARDRLTFDNKIYSGGGSKLSRQQTIYERRNPQQIKSSTKIDEEIDNAAECLMSSSEDDFLDKSEAIQKAAAIVSPHVYNGSTNGFQNNFEESNQSINLQGQTPRSMQNRNMQPEMGRAKLRCKTPIHYAADKRISDMRTPVPPRLLSPLKTPKLSRTPKIMKRICPDDQRKKELEKLFQKLDLDEDGHLSFELIENIFCKNLNHAQYSFVKQMYNILSDSTFFGIHEFKTFILLLEVILKQKYRNLNSVNFNVDEEDSLENYWEHFMATDFEDYQKEIMDYIKLMESLDMTKKLNVLDIMKTRFKSMDADKLVKALTQHFDSQYLYLQLNYTIKGGDVLSSKILNLISLIPLFIYIESIVRNKIIFKRRQNTILNLKDATNLHNFNRRIFD